MILQAWLTLPSCLANSSSPTLVRMIFWSRVIVGSSLTRFKTSLGADNQGNPLHVRFDLSFYTYPVGRAHQTACSFLGNAPAPGRQLRWATPFRVANPATSS